MRLGIVHYSETVNGSVFPGSILCFRLINFSLSVAYKYNAVMNCVIVGNFGTVVWQ